MSQENTPVNVLPRRKAASVTRKFYGVGPKLVGVPSMKMTNKEQVLQGKGKVMMPEPGLLGFPAYPEVPHFLFGKRPGRAVRDIELYNAYWLISDRLKQVFESIDPQAFAFVKCEVEMADGSEPPSYWLCDVVRVLDAVDEEASTMRIQYYESGRKYYSFLGGASLEFREDINPRDHIFRLKYVPPFVVCDREFRSAVEAALVKGVRFKNLLKFY